MPGGDPFVVRVGTTTFALRRREVETVWVELGSRPNARHERRRRVGGGPEPLADRRTQLRQDRPLQSAHRQPPESRELSRRHGRAQGRPLHRPHLRPHLPRCSICLAPTASSPRASTKPSRAMSCSAAMRASRRRTCWSASSTATNLRLNLRLVLELKRLGRPLIVALNMSDVARARAATSSIARRSSRRSACRSSRRSRCSRAASARWSKRSIATTSARAIGRVEAPASSAADVEATQREVRRILDDIGYRVPARLALLHEARRHRAASGRGPAAAGGRAVPDVPGRVQLGRSADGPHRQRRRGDRRVDRQRDERRAAARACSSTASSPASAACSCSCRRS